MAREAHTKQNREGLLTGVGACLSWHTHTHTTHAHAQTQSERGGTLDERMTEGLCMCGWLGLCRGFIAAGRILCYAEGVCVYVCVQCVCAMCVCNVCVRVCVRVCVCEYVYVWDSPSPSSEVRWYESH